MENENRNVMEYADCGLYNPLTMKDRLVRNYINYMLTRTQEMFEWRGLPDTIPSREMERLLQMFGAVTIAKNDDGKYYAFRAGLGGERDIYYFPMESIISNPRYRGKPNLKIGVDCVVIRNDLMLEGLLPMFYKYAYQLAEADISLKWALINARVPAILKADNDNTAESARLYLKDIEEGQKLGLIVSKSFAEEGISTMNYSNSTANKIKDLLEAEQYIVSKWFNEIGLQSNFNMKREAINESEAGMNEDSLTPLVDSLLTFRKQGAEELNKLFGWNCSVELKSIWKEKHNENQRPIEDEI